ncbi:helix-turn-helix domain-containing protein [Aldersonia sp. NBC_00410]|uniref:AlkA N-terminal domain-containing protein n=1 Tax=Aldersonia sp. NBC_00410 TaxID=2975954 RepID=UPI0022546137|nr:AlkA N-terminal domain-containing protein [Aldersonia sp. NBC_00410]MCX5043849.1 helix-turn-helix domain-containing protein [Aldersonia sp. NBC_00410]
MTTVTAPQTSERTLDFDRCYGAASARDARFDGQFVIAVRTTGIYCRPSCPAITPKPRNVSFLPTAAAAQRAGYRACRRCLPDAAPGSPDWNVRSDLSARAMRLIVDGVIDREGVAGLAAALGYSPRQLTRALTEELGAGPLALARAHRAQTARLLIQRTRLPMSDVAFAAGFASIRQFNDTVREVFAATPTMLRADAARFTDSAPAVGTIALRLPYREPLDHSWLEWFLRAHAVPGIEDWTDGRFVRGLRLPRDHGVARLELRAGYVHAELSLADMRDLAPAVAKLRHLLDLDADPAAIDAALRSDPRLADAVAATPGIRVPGNLDGPELLIRTMIGQQISLAAASAHTARLVAELGDPVDGGEVTQLFPTPAAIAEHGAQVLTGPRRRVQSVVAAAEAIADGRLRLHAGRSAAELRADLLALDGVGPWTADYVVMRLLADPDVLLGSDLVVRRGAGELGLALDDSAHWAPWRSYVSMHLWRAALARREARRSTQ